jgi:hypothetical protein
MAGSVLAQLVGFYVAVVAPAILDASLKAVTLAAWSQAHKGLKSGVGEGVYERSDGDNTPPVRYAAKVCHLGPKFYVELTYLNGGRPAVLPSKRILIYDGETLACREVNALMRPHGEEARLYPVPDGNVRRHVHEFDFPFNPASLPSTVLDLPRTLRDRPDIVFAAGRDDVFASVPIAADPDLRAVVRFPRATGYNLGLFESIQDVTGYRHVASAKWDRSGGAWYVRAVETAHQLPKQNRKYQRLTYISFEANADVDPALFRLPALELVRGARLIHLRIGSGAADFYTNDPPAAAGRAGDSLLDGLRRLPLHAWLRPVAPAPREVSPHAGGK